MNMNVYAFTLRFFRFIRKFVPDGVRKSDFIQKSWYLLRQKLGRPNKHKQTVLGHISVHITDHCNLNCKACNHFCPVADENFLDIESFRRDCIRLAELTNGNIGTFWLMGGEPLLHPQVTVFFDIARTYFPNIKIVILSNGILLSKQPDTFWQSCQKNGIEVGISNYPVKIDRETIAQKVTTFGVVLTYWGDRNTEWGKIFVLDIHGQYNYKKKWNKCTLANTCTCLREGKIYACPTVAYISFFNKYFEQNLETTEQDYIDIYKVKNQQEIFDFLYKPLPFCRYCNPGNQESMEWGISKKEISEWT
ncbi:hypothetical protein AGMMS49965_22000 [Bacteroidia bacterium]|nr:hypothetical protein AGMMS49965_22000 [Bacteroidia bacterium]